METIFHQDSVPSHRSKMTIKWLEEDKIPFLRPQKWFPDSPDCALCDYWLWGYLKKLLRRRRIRTINGLKITTKAELKKLDQNMITRALIARPKRCREI